MFYKCILIDLVYYRLYSHGVLAQLVLNWVMHASIIWPMYRWHIFFDFLHISETLCTAINFAGLAQYF